MTKTKQHKIIQLPMFKPHACQEVILNDITRFIVAACGRRFGKTTLGLHWIFRNMIRLNGVHWWIAPIYSISKRSYEKFYSLFKPLITYRNIAELSYHLYNGSKIYFKSADKWHNLVGEGLMSVVFDEAAIIDYMCWQESVRAALMDYLGLCLFIGSPKGKNWLYKLYQEGQDPLKKDIMSYQFTSYDNPYLDRNEIDSLLDELPERIINQEINAQFIEDSSRVFIGLEEILQGSPEEPMMMRQYTHGIDLAKKVDFTVIVTMRNDNRQVVNVERFNKLDWKTQKERITSVLNSYPGVAYIDSTGVGDPIFEDLQMSGLNVYPFQFTNKSKSQIINLLSLDIQQYKLTIPIYFKKLIEEMADFTYNLTSMGVITYGATQGSHDDCVIALALANQACPYSHYGSLNDNFVSLEAKKGYAKLLWN